MISLIGWICILFILGLINLIIGIVGVKKFLSQRTSIKTNQSLQDFKKVARRQMVQTLLQMGVLGIMGILGIVGIVIGKLSLMEFLLFLLLNVVIIIIGKYCSGVEEKVRSLTVEDESLASEYTSVCETWVKKPFPDF